MMSDDNDDIVDTRVEKGCDNPRQERVVLAERYAEPEMRRTSGDQEFSTVSDLRDAASDCPRRRRTDYQL